MTIERRHFRNDKQRYGWTPGKAWWDYFAPIHPSGTDPTGWFSFLTAYVYEVGDQFLAVSLGCHWEGGERVWSPSWALCLTLETAFDYCEDEMVRNGVLPPFAEI